MFVWTIGSSCPSHVLRCCPIEGKVRRASLKQSAHKTTEAVEVCFSGIVRQHAEDSRGRPQKLCGISPFRSIFLSTTNQLQVGTSERPLSDLGLWCVFRAASSLIQQGT